MGRADLIGPGKHHLVPNWQPAGTGLSGGEGARMGRKKGEQVFLTKGADKATLGCSGGETAEGRTSGRPNVPAGRPKPAPARPAGGPARPPRRK